MYFFLVICCSILLILIYYVFVKTFVENLRNSVPNEPKLVRSYIPIFGFSFAMSKNPVGLLQSLHRKHGPFFVIDLLYRRNIMLNDEKAFVNHIAKDHCFSLGFLNEIFTDFCGIRPECLTNEEMRLTTHKQLIDYLSGNELEMLNEKTFEHLIKRLNEDRSGDVLNLFDYFSEIMFDTASTVLYGETFTQSQGKDFYSSCQNFDSAFGSLLIKIPFRAIFMSSPIRKRDEFVNRFRHLKINDDMSRLVQARIEFFEDFNNGKEHFFTDRDWAGQHAFLLWAAVINTIPVLCWTLVDILLHPEALEAVRKELRSFDKSKLYQKDILSNLIILESCIYETMRRTIVAKSVRQAECNTTVFCTNGLQFNVRKNDMITYTACVKHLDPQVYENPKQFIYDRFAKEQGKVPFPLLFGTGSLMCPGRYLAINEMKLALAVILDKFNIQLLMDDAFKVKMSKELEYKLSSALGNAGPRDEDRHQFRIRYTYQK